MPKTRTLTVAWRIITQIRRDHRTVGLIFIVPMVVIGLLGYIIRLPAEDINLAIVNEDQGFSSPLGMSFSLGDELVEALQESEDLVISEISESEAEENLKAGEIDAVLVFDEDFTQRVAEEQRIEFILLLEGSDPALNTRVQGTMSREFIEAVQRIEGLPGGPPPFKLEVETQYLYAGQNFDTLDSLAPVFIAFVAFFLIFLLTGVSFLRERAGGTLERLMATPVTRLEVVLGYMIGFGFFALIQSAVILLFVIYILGIHYVGNPALIFLVEALLTIGSVNLGIFLSTYAKNELQIVQFIPLVITPQVLLSGILVPVEEFPNWLQGLAYLMPLTYANQALKNVMLKGFDLYQIGWELAVLAGFALLMIFLSALTLRREVA
ncbi:MAG: ABC-2 transporter permease [Chloroflexi bacterium]|nr:ABC-2 transporter permease [Chloroflexota bacterium]